MEADKKINLFSSSQILPRLSNCISRSLLLMSMTLTVIPIFNLFRSQELDALIFYYNKTWSGFLKHITVTLLWVWKWNISRTWGEPGCEHSSPRWCTVLSRTVVTCDFVILACLCHGSACSSPLIFWSLLLNVNMTWDICLYACWNCICNMHK